ncbi:MAG: type IV pilin accessory protein [Xanthomonadales bacterium]|nr:type IV pilin accessory protein [Xanthomonadales bacterium]
MGIRNLNRWQAFAWHLCGSLMLAGAVFLLFWKLWYPGALFNASGADRLLLLIAGVDVVVGPLLTLIVFNPAKKSLKLDLAVIVVLQLAAMAYGTQVILASRPVFLVGAVDRFKLVSANEIASADLAEGSRIEFRSLPWSGPQPVGASPPTDPDESFRLATEVLAGKPDIDRLPKYYRPLDEVRAALIAKAIPLDRVAPIDGKGRSLKEALRSIQQDSASDLALLPIDARFGSIALPVELASGRFLAPIAFDLESAQKR